MKVELFITAHAQLQIIIRSGNSSHVQRIQLQYAHSRTKSTGKSCILLSASLVHSRTPFKWRDRRKQSISSTGNRNGYELHSIIDEGCASSINSVNPALTNTASCSVY